MYAMKKEQNRNKVGGMLKQPAIEFHFVLNGVKKLIDAI